MELIITPYKLNDLETLASADAFLLGNDSFGVRLAASFSNKEILEAIKKAHKLNKKLYVNVNKIFTQKEIDKLEPFLKELKDNSVDGIFFSDFAVLEIAKRLNVVDKLVYYSETQMVNYLDAKVINSLGIKDVIISKDVTLDNIEEFASHCDFNLGLNIYGYYHLFYSKRKLIRNYFDKYKTDSTKYIKNTNLTLKESQREDFYPIYQDDNGTQVFSGEILLGIDYLNKFIDLGYSKFIIDGVFEDVKYLKDILDYFVLAKNNKNKKYSEEIKNKYQDHSYGSAFYFKKIGVAN